MLPGRGLALAPSSRSLNVGAREPLELATQVLAQLADLLETDLRVWLGRLERRGDGRCAGGTPPPSEAARDTSAERGDCAADQDPGGGHGLAMVARAVDGSAPDPAWSEAASVATGVAGLPLAGAVAPAPTAAIKRGFVKKRRTCRRKVTNPRLNETRGEASFSR
jgi:hypothetical protein